VEMRKKIDFHWGPRTSYLEEFTWCPLFNTNTVLKEN